MILSTHGIVGSQIAQFVGLLDAYPSASAAYSLRKLRTAYTGSAIRVRRASDNTEQNIGFVNNILDTASLTSFCSGTNGFVTTWYDQSGNANNAEQATAAKQPQIVSSGSIINVNSKPCIQFTNTLTTHLNLTSSIWTYTGNSTLFHTSRNRNTSSNEYGSVISQYGGVNGSIGIQWQQFPNAATQASTDVYAPGGMSTSGTQSANVQYLATFKWQNWSTHKTNGDTIIAINGTNQTLSAYGGNPSGLTLIAPRIGTFDNTGGGSFLGDIQELVIYTTAFSQVDIDGAEDNINDFYNIY